MNSNILAAFVCMGFGFVAYAVILWTFDRDSGPT